MPEPDMSVWTGRVDSADGPLALRWHQRVKALVPGAKPGIALVGFACDEGVRRNGGRVGAKEGPRAIRAALANLAWHHGPAAYDAGDVECAGEDLEGAQSRLAAAVAGAVRAGHRPLVLGGGHETAWGTFQGVAAAWPGAKIGVVNIDTHFDLRGDPRPTSGTPFAQIANWCREQGRPFRYLCVGVSRVANTLALFERARELGAVWKEDVQCGAWMGDIEEEWFGDFAAEVDCIHLGIDLDVLPASTMPAVSAPAARGVPLEVVTEIVHRFVELPKTVAVDLVEYNPALDADGRGARMAAYLAWQVAFWWAATNTGVRDDDTIPF
jgi:formiminoglutamase